MESVGAMRIDYRVVLPAAAHLMGELDETARRVLPDRKLIELVQLRASQLNGCGHCVKVHAHNAIVLGEDEERVRAVDDWQGSGRFDDRERAAFAWCDALTLLPLGQPTSDAYTAVAGTFEPREIVALTVAIITVNGWNRLHLGLGAPSTPISAAEHGAEGRVGDERMRQLADRLRHLEAALAGAQEAYQRALEDPLVSAYRGPAPKVMGLQDLDVVPPG